MNTTYHKICYRILKNNSHNIEELQTSYKVCIDIFNNSPILLVADYPYQFLISKCSIRHQKLLEKIILIIRNKYNIYKINYKVELFNLFKKFLDNNNIKKKFKTNLFNSLHLYLKDYISYVSPYEYCVRCFTWEDTPQGQDYWGTINKKWQQELINIII